MGKKKEPRPGTGTGTGTTPPPPPPPRAPAAAARHVRTPPAAQQGRQGAAGGAWDAPLCCSCRGWCVGSFSRFSSGGGAAPPLALAVAALCRVPEHPPHGCRPGGTQGRGMLAACRTACETGKRASSSTSPLPTPKKRRGQHTGLGTGCFVALPLLAAAAVDGVTDPKP